jgi:hypothetical protein
LNNAPEHPQSLQDFYPDITVVFVPHNPTCLIQPMDWSVIVTLKKYCIGSVNSQSIRATVREGGPTPEEILERL